MFSLLSSDQDFELGYQGGSSIVMTRCGDRETKLMHKECYDPGQVTVLNIRLVLIQ